MSKKFYDTLNISGETCEIYEVDRELFISTTSIDIPSNTIYFIQEPNGQLDTIISDNIINKTGFQELLSEKLS